MPGALALATLGMQLVLQLPLTGGYSFPAFSKATEEETVLHGPTIVDGSNVKPSRIELSWATVDAALDYILSLLTEVFRIIMTLSEALCFDLI